MYTNLKDFIRSYYADCVTREINAPDTLDGSTKRMNALKEWARDYFVAVTRGYECPDESDIGKRFTKLQTTFIENIKDISRTAMVAIDSACVSGSYTDITVEILAAWEKVLDNVSDKELVNCLYAKLLDCFQRSDMDGASIKCSDWSNYECMTCSDETYVKNLMTAVCDTYTIKSEGVDEISTAINPEDTATINSDETPRNYTVDLSRYFIGTEVRMLAEYGLASDTDTNWLFYRELKRFGTDLAAIIERNGRYDWEQVYLHPDLTKLNPAQQDYICKLKKWYDTFIEDTADGAINSCDYELCKAFCEFCQLGGVKTATLYNRLYRLIIETSKAGHTNDYMMEQLDNMRGEVEQYEADVFVQEAFERVYWVYYGAFDNTDTLDYLQKHCDSVAVPIEGADGQSSPSGPADEEIIPGTPMDILPSFDGLYTNDSSNVLYKELVLNHFYKSYSYIRRAYDLTAHPMKQGIVAGLWYRLVNIMNNSSSMEYPAEWKETGSSILAELETLLYGDDVIMMLLRACVEDWIYYGKLSKQVSGVVPSAIMESAEAATVAVCTAGFMPEISTDMITKIWECVILSGLSQQEAKDKIAGMLINYKVEELYPVREFIDRLYAAIIESTESDAITYEELMLSLIYKEYDFVTEGLEMSSVADQREYIRNMWEQTVRTVNTCYVFDINQLHGLLEGLLEAIKYAAVQYNSIAIVWLETAVTVASKASKCAFAGRLGEIPADTVKAAQEATEAVLAMGIADYKKGLIITDVWKLVYYGRNSINLYDTQVSVLLQDRKLSGYTSFKRCFKRLQELVSRETWEFPNEEPTPPEGGGGNPSSKGPGTFNDITPLLVMVRYHLERANLEEFEIFKKIVFVMWDKFEHPDTHYGDIFALVDAGSLRCDTIQAVRKAFEDYERGIEGTKDDETVSRWVCKNLDETIEQVTTLKLPVYYESEYQTAVEQAHKCSIAGWEPVIPHIAMKHTNRVSDILNCMGTLHVNIFYEGLYLEEMRRELLTHKTVLQISRKGDIDIKEMSTFIRFIDGILWRYYREPLQCAAWEVCRAMRDITLLSYQVKIKERIEHKGIILEYLDNLWNKCAALMNAAIQEGEDSFIEKLSETLRYIPIAVDFSTGNLLEDDIMGGNQTRRYLEAAMKYLRN